MKNKEWKLYYNSYIIFTYYILLTRNRMQLKNSTPSKSKEKYQKLNKINNLLQILQQQKRFI